MTALGPRTRRSGPLPRTWTIPFCECANTTPTPTEPSCGIGGGAGGRWGLSCCPGRPSRPFREAPRALLRAQGSAGSGPRAWGQGVCCSACRPASLEAAASASAVPVASPWPPRFPLVAGEEGLRAHSPPLLLRAPQPSASRSPLLSCGHGARRAGPRMGSSFRARPLPSSPTLVLRVLCLASPRPKRRSHRAALGAEDPVLGQRAGGCPGSVPREKRPRCRRPRRRVVGKERRAGQASSPVLPDGRPEVGRETGSGRPASAQPQPGPQWDQPHIPQMPRVTAWSLFILYLFEQSYVLTIFIDLLT